MIFEILFALLWAAVGAVLFWAYLVIRFKRRQRAAVEVPPAVPLVLIAAAMVTLYLLKKNNEDLEGLCDVAE